MIDPGKFLEDMSGQYARIYTGIIQEMVVMKTLGNKVALAAARKLLAETMIETMGAAEVLGASLTLQKAAAILVDEGVTMKRDAPYMVAFADQPIIPRVTFSEAVQDLIDRTPVTLRPAAERTAQAVSKIYSTGVADPLTGEVSPVIAFVRSAEAAVTKRVQSLIATAIREGDTEIYAGGKIVKDVDEIRKRTAAWSEGYARMAFRTNVNTAVTAGRFRQTQDPAVKMAIPCFRFDSVSDVDTRDNHRAADGLIFKRDNPIWQTIAPPLGYNCRCDINFVGLPELRRMGRVLPNGDIREDKRMPVYKGSRAGPDEGFRHGGRPDLLMGSR